MKVLEKLVYQENAIFGLGCWAAAVATNKDKQFLFITFLRVQGLGFSHFGLLRVSDLRACLNCVFMFEGFGLLLQGFRVKGMDKSLM